RDYKVTGVQTCALPIYAGCDRRGSERSGGHREQARHPAVGSLDPAQVPPQAGGASASGADPGRRRGRCVIEIEARLGELEALGLHRRTRLVSGPQGPHVLLDGKPVLMLSSNNYLGLADHPRVREAAAEAAMRWGVGAG